MPVTRQMSHGAVKDNHRMPKRKGQQRSEQVDAFRQRVEAEHRPRFWPVRLLILVIVLAVCGWVGYVNLSNLVQPGTSTGPGLDLGRVSSLDQLALTLYLRLRQNDIEARSSGSGDIPFAVQSGDTPATIGARLQKLALIQDSELFRQLTRARGVESRLEAGDYMLQRGMTMDEILLALQHGVVTPNTVRVIEGRRLEEISSLLDRQNVVSSNDFVAAARAGSYPLAELKDRPAGSSLEGFLFPDTYQIPKGATAQQLVSIMLSNFDQKIGSELWAKASAQGQNPYQLLIVASIVEREAQNADERPIIASVYLNRVKKGMRLEADPTVQYAMGFQPEKGTWWKSPVSLDEYSKVASPYNTYLHEGLPPTPICNPGRDSIRATIDPAKTEYLFFLGKGDGSHVFARTFEEHQANIAKYQR